LENCLVFKLTDILESRGEQRGGSAKGAEAPCSSIAVGRGQHVACYTNDTLQHRHYRQGLDIYLEYIQN